MRCKYCNARLASHDLWCVDCGRQSQAVKNDLSAMASLAATYKKQRQSFSSSVPGFAFAVILGLIPICAVLYLFHSIISLDSNTVVGTFVNHLVKAIALSVFIPFILIAFKPICGKDNYSLGLSEMFSALRDYPRYFAYSLINALFFALIHLICYGVPGFSSHPILRLVWLILVNYWLAISVPALVLMEELPASAWAAIKKSYRHFHDVRWNLYLMVIVLGLMNLFALLLFFLLFVPSVLMLSLSVFALRDYVRRLIAFELLEYRR
ncbi:hypothetical protein MASR1M36_03610 [Candidatus Cloacimonadaceae bacterium]